MSDRYDNLLSVSSGLQTQGGILKVIGLIPVIAAFVGGYLMRDSLGFAAVAFVVGLRSSTSGSKSCCRSANGNHVFAEEVDAPVGERNLFILVVGPALIVPGVGGLPSARHLLSGLLS